MLGERIAKLTYYVKSISKAIEKASRVRNTYMLSQLIKDCIPPDYRKKGLFHILFFQSIYHSELFLSRYSEPVAPFIKVKDDFKYVLLAYAIASATFLIERTGDITIEDVFVSDENLNFYDDIFPLVFEEKIMSALDEFSRNTQITNVEVYTATLLALVDEKPDRREIFGFYHYLIDYILARYGEEIEELRETDKLLRDIFSGFLNIFINKFGGNKNDYN